MNKYLVTSMNTVPRYVSARNPREAVRKAFLEIKRRDELKQIAQNGDIIRFFVIPKKLEVQVMELEHCSDGDFSEKSYDIDVDDCEKDGCNNCCDGCGNHSCDDPF